MNSLDGREQFAQELKHSILMTYDSEENNSSSYVNADFTAGISYGVQKIFNHADLVLQEALISKVSYKTYKNNSVLSANYRCKRRYSNQV